MPAVPPPPGYVCRDFGPTWKCPRHGDLPVDRFLHRHQPNRHGNGLKCRLSCRLCQQDKAAKRWEADPEASKSKLRQWRRDNPDRWKELVGECYRRNRGKYLANAKAKREAVRTEVLRHYADQLKCSLCGEPNERFLVIDHVGGGGSEHRKAEKCHGSAVYSWLKKNGFPLGFRVLCHNCNFREALRLRRLTTVDRDPSDAASIRLKARQKCAALTAYSGGAQECACCGEADETVLSIDHIEGGGRKHRQETGDGSNFYRWLAKQGYPDGYRVLCLNCNFTLGLGHGCSH